jgi:DNA-binding NarL/FixJ family response regulator
MCRLLQDNYEAIGVANGEELLEAVGKHHPDLVLLDISLPGIDGITACRQLMKMHPHLKLIFVTAHGGVAYIREAFRCGAQGYLLKRDLAVELSAAVGQVLAGSQVLSAGLTMPER